MIHALQGVAHGHHDALVPHVDALAAIADEIGRGSSADLAERLAAEHRFITSQLVPHLEQAEQTLYPALERLLQNRHSMTPMRREHELLRKLIAELAELRTRPMEFGELGADDYLVKPFAFSELLARVRSILRRGSVRQAETLRIADLDIDFRQHKAMRGGRRLDLTPKEFALLSLLARRGGEVLSRTLIAEQVWDMNFDCGTNVVDVHVRRLRSKVDDPFVQKLIHTIRGVGYVLEERR